MTEFSDSIKARTARKAQLIQKLRKMHFVGTPEPEGSIYTININMEDLLELMSIIAGETIEEYDAKGFFDNCGTCGGTDE